MVFIFTQHLRDCASDFSCKNCVSFVLFLLIIFPTSKRMLKGIKIINFGLKSFKHVFPKPINFQLVSEYFFLNALKLR